MRENCVMRGSTTFEKFVWNVMRFKFEGLKGDFQSHM